MTHVAAVILAGGRGERLGGVNKALLPIGRRRFVDVAAGATAGCSPRLLAVGHSNFEAPAELVQVRDLDTGYAGPLAGVAAAMNHLAGSRAEFLLSLAVDSPLFPRDFLARALPLLASAAAVIASYRAQDYPTNAVWRCEAIAGLPDAVRAGTAPRSLKRLAEGLHAVRLDYAARTNFDPFRNANTAEDLAFLREAVGRGGGA